MTAPGPGSTNDAAARPRSVRRLLVRRAWFPHAATVLLWTKRDFETLYRRSALQLLWAVLQPVLAVAVYAVIYGVIFDADSGSIPYLTYLLSGMVIFRAISLALNSNACLSDNYHVIAHAHVSCEVIPIARFAGSLPDVIITTVLLVVVGAIQGVELHRTIVLLPVVMAGAAILSAAAAIIISTLQVFVRDVRFAVPLLIQALFFATPIAYDPDQLPSWLTWLAVVNPISVMVEALRDVALVGVQPDWPLLVLHMAIASGLLVASIAHLRAVQHRIVDLG